MIKVYIASRNTDDLTQLESNFFRNKNKLTIKDLEKGMIVACNIVLNHIEFRDDSYQLVWYLHGGVIADD